MPAIPRVDYLIPQWPKHAVRVRTSKDHTIPSNILDSQVTNNSRCFSGTSVEKQTIDILREDCY